MRTFWYRTNVIQLSQLESCDPCVNLLQIKWKTTRTSVVKVYRYNNPERSGAGDCASAPRPPPSARHPRGPFPSRRPPSKGKWWRANNASWLTPYTHTPGRCVLLRCFVPFQSTGALVLILSDNFGRLEGVETEH